MMSNKWHTTRILKEIDIFTVRLNEVFTIKNKKGVDRWRDPKFIINVRTITTKGFFFEFDFQTIEVDKGYYKIITKNDNLIENSMFDVLVMEGDAPATENTTPTDFNGNWMTINVLSATYSKIQILKLNKDNNYSFRIPNSHNKTFKTMIQPSIIKYLEGAYYFEYRLKEVEKDVFKLEFWQKGSSDVQSVLELNANRNREIYVPKEATTMSVTVLEYLENGNKPSNTITAPDGRIIIPNHRNEVPSASFVALPLYLTLSTFFLENKDIGGVYKWNPSNTASWTYIPPILLCQYSVRSNKAISIDNFECYIVIIEE